MVDGMKKKILLGAFLFLVVFIGVVWFVFHNYVYLLVAVEDKNKEQINHLINLEKTNPNSFGINLINIYLYKLKEGEPADIDYISYLIDMGVNPDYDFGQHVLPIDVAIINNRNDVLKLLIDKGADVNLSLKKNGVYPLNVAIFVDNCEAAIILYEAGAQLKDYNIQSFKKTKLKKCYLTSQSRRESLDENAGE